MKNIHLFETKNAYDAAKSSLILPRVSYIKENKDVKYNPTFDANGHEFVVIAGIKWATMNVGANDVTDYGLYFQWGDTSGYTKDEIEKEHKKKFASDWSDYTKFTTNGGSTFMKYNGTDGYTELALEDDAVHAAWGGSWRMPTKGEMQTVLKSTAVTKNWIPNYQGSGVNGLLCSTKTEPSKTLFFPACGYAGGGSVDGVGSYGRYWLSSLGTGSVSRAYGLYFGSDDASVGGDRRCYGRCVRGVLDKI